MRGISLDKVAAYYTGLLNNGKMFTRKCWWAATNINRKSSLLISMDFLSINIPTSMGVCPSNTCGSSFIIFNVFEESTSNTRVGFLYSERIFIQVE